MPLTLLPGQAVSRSDGEIMAASLVACGCGNELFIIFTVNGHQHVQCIECETSYCDGACGATDNGPQSLTS